MTDKHWARTKKNGKLHFFTSEYESTPICGLTKGKPHFLSNHLLSKSPFIEFCTKCIKIAPLQTMIKKPISTMKPFITEKINIREK
jgi:hypothetical protein